MTTIEFFRTAYFIRNSEHTRHSNMLRVRDDLRAPAGLAHDVWAWNRPLRIRRCVCRNHLFRVSAVVTVSVLEAVGMLMISTAAARPVAVTAKVAAGLSRQSEWPWRGVLLFLSAGKRYGQRQETVTANLRSLHQIYRRPTMPKYGRAKSTNQLRIN